ncbi:MAG: BMP family lipoprotein [Bacillota bacterium]
MKKVVALLMMLTFVFTLAACQGGDGNEIALITDVGDIDDESFNQGAWEGVEEYAEDNDITYDYYKPSEESDSSYINAIELAIDNGAEIVVTPGYLFERAVYEMQDEYPDVSFILLDAEPIDEDGNVEVADNTVSVFYEEQESGFLAGYAAVKDGFTDLGFMGGYSVPAVIRFGVGYVAGAYYAAEEEDVSLSFPNDRYTYLDSFDPSDEINNEAASWFSSDTEVIFSAAGGAGSSVMDAAEDEDAWMIGVDTDQSENSDKVLTSATKALATSVQEMLGRYYDDDFPGGETIRLGADQDGVSLPMENSRFTNFDEDAYDAIYSEIADGTLDVPENYDELVDFFDENGLEENALNPDNEDDADGIRRDNIIRE